MSKQERSARGEARSGEPLARREQGQKMRGPAGSKRPPASSSAGDPHPAWLREWRSLRSGVGDLGGADVTRMSVQELQRRLAHTPAETLEGLQAQAELISELAWNDLVAATARQLLAGIKRLKR